MTKWRQRLVIGALVLGLGGLVLGVQHLVTGFHPTASTRTPATTSAGTVAQVTSVKSEVDTGTTLNNKPAPNFTLTNQFGHPMSLQQFRGKVVVLSFIDSRCTTVCPLTAVVLRNVNYDLGRYRREVRFVAVNANPMATSVADIRQWSITHHMLHLWQYGTGSKAQLQAIWRHYYVASQIIKGDVIQHTPAVYVIGPQGREQWLYLNASDGRAPVLTLEVHDLLTHIAPLLPGHPSLQQFPQARELTYLAGKLGPSGTPRSFTAPAILPGGARRTVTVGHGHPAALLDFFATWCPDCQEEVPVLKAYTQAAKRHHWPAVIGVDMRLSEPSTAHVAQYAARTHLPYAVALDTHGNIAAAYGVSGIPTEVLVSSSGHILWYHQGLIAEAALRQAVQRYGTPGG